MENNGDQNNWGPMLQRILENTEVTRNDLTAYKHSNDLRVSKLETQINDYEKRLSACEERASQPSPSSAGGMEAEELHVERELSKQHSLKNHICIPNIPRSSNECIDKIVKVVMSAIGIKLNSGDITGHI